MIRAYHYKVKILRGKKQSVSILLKQRFIDCSRVIILLLWTGEFRYRNEFKRSNKGSLQGIFFFFFSIIAMSDFEIKPFKTVILIIDYYSFQMLCSFLICIVSMFLFQQKP